MVSVGSGPGGLQFQLCVVDFGGHRHQPVAQPLVSWVGLGVGIPEHELVDGAQRHGWFEQAKAGLVGHGTWAMAPEYGLLVTPPAQRAMDRLPERVAAAVAELLTGDLLAAPRRVGKPPRRELSGLWSARRGSYRVIYEIDD
jgi:mRNA interferase RelE/StbE